MAAMSAVGDIDMATPGKVPHDHHEDGQPDHESATDVEALASEDSFAREKWLLWDQVHKDELQMKKDNKVVITTGNHLHCSNTDCDRVLCDMGDHIGVVLCKKCEHSTCAACGNVAHNLTCRPSDFNDEAFLMTARSQGYMHCPKCKGFVEHIGGGNNMACPTKGCGTNFCMVCGQKWGSCKCPKMFEDDKEDEKKDDEKENIIMRLFRSIIYLFSLFFRGDKIDTAGDKNDAAATNEKADVTVEKKDKVTREKKDDSVEVKKDVTTGEKQEIVDEDQEEKSDVVVEQKHDISGMTSGKTANVDKDTNDNMKKSATEENIDAGGKVDKDLSANENSADPSDKSTNSNNDNPANTTPDKKVGVTAQDMPDRDEEPTTAKGKLIKA